MSFLGSGLVGNALSTMMGGALDSVLSGEDLETSPIPSFYFEVDFFDIVGYKSAELSTPGASDNSLGANLMSAAQGMVTGPNMLKPGDYDGEWYLKSFIEVSGLEIGIDNDQKTEGGNNFPLNLPGKLRNQPVILKRLIRKKTIQTDRWSIWIKETIDSAKYWNTAIVPKNIQINVMHPNLQPMNGQPFILISIELLNAYPTKLSYGTLTSTSEDLLTEEIEISFMSISIVSPDTSSPIGV